MRTARLRIFANSLNWFGKFDNRGQPLARHDRGRPRSAAMAAASHDEAVSEAAIGQGVGNVYAPRARRQRRAYCSWISLRHSAARRLARRRYGRDLRAGNRCGARQETAFPERGGGRRYAISFADEEGTFLACLGSRSFCGALHEPPGFGRRSECGGAIKSPSATHRATPDWPDGIWQGADRSRAASRLFRGAYRTRPQADRTRMSISASFRASSAWRRHRVRFQGQADHAEHHPRWPCASRRGSLRACSDLRLRMSPSVSCAAGFCRVRFGTLASSISSPEPPTWSRATRSCVGRVP